MGDEEMYGALTVFTINGRESTEPVRRERYKKIIASHDPHRAHIGKLALVWGDLLWWPRFLLSTHARSITFERSSCKTRQRWGLPCPVRQLTIFRNFTVALRVKEELQKPRTCAASSSGEVVWWIERARNLLRLHLRRSSTCPATNKSSPVPHKRNGWKRSWTDPLDCWTFNNFTNISLHVIILLIYTETKIYKK